MEGKAGIGAERAASDAAAVAGEWLPRCINCTHANADGFCRWEQKNIVLDAPACQHFNLDIR